MLEIKKGVKSFYIGDSEDEPIAMMGFVISGDKLVIIDTSYVSEELKGQGVGSLLLDELANWARSENRKIIPLCPFAKAQTDKYAKYDDVVHRG